MKRLVLFLWALITALPCFGLEAGAAKIEITPELGTPLNGYGDRLSRGAESVHDPLWARCLFLDDGETNLFLVNLDLCVVTRELRQAVLSVAPSFVPPERIILTATHTHNGTGGMTRHLLFRSISGRYMPDVVDGTADRIAQCMNLAYDNRERATIGYGTATQNVLATNRSIDDGPVDEQIGVIRVDDADGRPISIVTNFAAHPTTIGEADRYAISADYPGYYYTELERLTDEKCVALFMNGAEGDQRCANPENNDGWERTESIGRLLAIRAKEVANRIECRELSLHVGYRQATLPKSLAARWMPDSTTVQTLEIGGLLVCFFPGEPCVQLGLDLRQRARSFGYDAQFSVGLANDHLLYFADHATFRRPAYESAMNLFGPDMNGWFQNAFVSLMTRAPESAGQGENGEAPAVDEVDGGVNIALTGNAYDIGFQQGRAFGGTIRERYRDLVAQPMTNRDWLPADSGWYRFPDFVDVSTLTEPLLAANLRPMLGAVSDDTFNALRGFASGADLPFDAVWLLQCAPAISAREEVTELLTAPFCTMLAVGGGEEQAVVAGRNFDWPQPDISVITNVEPDEGFAYAHIGFPWSLGVYTGMNAAGVAVSVERVEAQGRPGLDTPPIDLLLRDVLLSSANFDAAIARLQSFEDLRGYHVIVAGPSGAAVVEFGDRIVVRRAEGNLLLGGDPGAERLDDAARIRYERAAQIFENAEGGDRERIEAVLGDTGDGLGNLSSILNEKTRHSVVFVPASREMHVRLVTGPGELGEVQSIQFARPRTEAAQP